MIRSDDIAKELEHASENLDKLSNSLRYEGMDLKDVCSIAIFQCELLKSRVLDFVKQEESEQRGW